VAGQEEETEMSSSTHLKKFAGYGTQALASDFAYDRDQKFFKKPISHHIGIFAVGGLGGVAQGFAAELPDKAFELSKETPLGAAFARTGLSLGSYFIEYTTMSWVYGGYNSMYFKSPGTKVPSYLHKGSANMFSIFRNF
jgi:hypothetical protein